MICQTLSTILQKSKNHTMKNQMNNLLVTGAAGFIGSNFVKFMNDKYPEIKIISLDKLTYAGNKANLSEMAECKNHLFVQGDILDRSLVLSLLREYEIDTLVHFAAESHVDNSIDNPQIFLETNVIGTFTLLEAARIYWLNERQWDKSKCRFHHVSTDEVYGSLEREEPAFTEKNSYQPNSPYSASKASSDHIVRAYYHTYGLPVTTSNCSNNYGPNQHKEKLIPKVVYACVNQLPITVYGNGSNIRDWLYVMDHCEAIDTIIQKGALGEVYNIGGNNELDNLSLIKMICQMMDDLKPMEKPYHSLITFVEDRKGHDKRYAIDNSKIQKELGWVPQGDFVHKLSNTVQHYLTRYEREINV
ncbi:TPA: dTDP-glucose 4,6-dehydratase [Legionella pneumophila]|uniref:dTDP-glucose 4,6-dehydratase n=1 Tax=Legionella pneumophila TaxID=446 RepID=UPI000770A21C|nr:dTDP-glucose 4,6-dehydratase [Legionella pneumophila]MDW9034462.1 dTDP-glucose 4,6-dehydratase [Legionella pneumophila subsp. fraseri]HAT8829613.1 dTDP-glucose 4,6-dehydratase [Legionella pneumophila subsp. pneumophila]MDW9037862.1 dTDP-glucose 4,6-dehydratase [Legionella pneumophila subsp. fraseri]MDW9040583.1 dTDP-glucose 4,6-dehydratase [Legionella pneumophila subsp. fraseri]MDW9062134.1 dTDP-glucose 4,6-dehydratase [Legionella pneumophila subsp. fraseri]